jgi:hypothetical protein
MTDQHDRWMVAQEFRCVSPGGDSTVVNVRIGFPEDDVAVGGNRWAKCRIGLEPLARDRTCGGGNGFQAVCLSLDYIRNVFKVFLAEGGRIYWEDGDSPVDADSPWFAPMLSPKDVGLKLLGR